MPSLCAILADSRNLATIRASAPLRGNRMPTRSQFGSCRNFAVSATIAFACSERVAPDKEVDLLQSDVPRAPLSPKAFPVADSNSPKAKRIRAPLLRSVALRRMFLPMSRPRSHRDRALRPGDRLVSPSLASDAVAAARRSGQSGQCAPSKPVTSKLRKIGRDFAAWSRASAVRSVDKLKPAIVHNSFETCGDFP